MDKTAIKIISYFDGIEEFLIGLLFFTLPFGWKFSIIPLVLFTITLLINAFTKPVKLSKEKLLYFAPLLAIFVLGAISLFYSTGVEGGIKILTTQLVMLVVTLAFLFNNITREAVKKGFYLFLWGCLSVMLLQYGMAIFASSSIIGDAYVFRPFFDATAPCLVDSDITGHYFLSNSLSRFVHPAYSAFMLGMAMMIIFKGIRYDSDFFNYKKFWMLCFGFFGFSLIFFSLNGTITLLFVLSLLVVGTLSVRKQFYGEYAKGFYTMIMLFALVMLINPQVRSVVEAPSDSTSLALRIKVTEASLEMISANWFAGVGIGDAQDVLYSAYNDGGDASCRKINSHNQFLTTWLQNGIIGIVALISAFVAVMMRARRKKMNVLHFFNVIVVVSFFFESMLLRYWGVVSFTLFYGMLYFYSEPKPAAIEES